MSVRTCALTLAAALAVWTTPATAQQPTDTAAPVYQTEKQREAQDELDEAVSEVRAEAREQAREFREEAAERAQERCEERSDRRHGGAFNVQLLYLDRDFLSYVKKYSPSQERPYLNLSDRDVLMIGGMTYTSLPGDVRLGTGGWIGYKVFRSADYDVPYVDTATGDSGTCSMTTTLRVVPALIGGVVEKNFQLGPVGIFAGALLGGGVFVVVRQASRAGDIFADIDQQDVDALSEDASTAVAPCLTGDLHGGVVVRLAPALHLGVEFVALCTYAPEGFVTGTAVGDFFTVSPSARIRLQFGKAAE